MLLRLTLDGRPQGFNLAPSYTMDEVREAIEDALQWDAKVALLLGNGEPLEFNPRDVAPFSILEPGVI